MRACIDTSTYTSKFPITNNGKYAYTHILSWICLGAVSIFQACSSSQKLFQKPELFQLFTSKYLSRINCIQWQIVFLFLFVIGKGIFSIFIVLFFLIFSFFCPFILYWGRQYGFRVKSPALLWTSLLLNVHGGKFTLS